MSNPDELIEFFSEIFNNHISQNIIKFLSPKAPKVRLGYACINLSLKPKKVTCNKTCRLATIQKYPTPDEKYKFLIEKSLENLHNLKIIIQWHIDNNHRFYRLSSDMFPHISSPQIEPLLTPNQLYNYRNLIFALEILEEIGIMAYQNGIRLTMHPGQYNQLGSPTQKVVDKTFVDLAWQARIFDVMEEGIYRKLGKRDTMKDSTLCIHGGGVYKGKGEALERWQENFKKMPENIQRRIALENCEKGYCVDDLLPVCQNLRIPLIFDFFHYICYDHFHKNETQRPISELLPEILETWKIRGMTPKFHLSEQAPNKAVGAHSDYVEKIPQELIQLAKTGYRFDIMIEAKEKDLAMFHLFKKYPQFNPNLIGDRKNYIKNIPQPLNINYNNYNNYNKNSRPVIPKLVPKINQNQQEINQSKKILIVKKDTTKLIPQPQESTEINQLQKILPKNLPQKILPKNLPQKILPKNLPPKLLIKKLNT